MVDRRIELLVTIISAADRTVMPVIHLGVFSAKEIAVGIHWVGLPTVLLRPDAFHTQAGSGRHSLHPVEGDIGEVVVLMSATHVAVRTNEPSLLDRLLQLHFRFPECDVEDSSMFVEGDCVIGVPNDAAQFRIVESIIASVDLSRYIERNAQGTDGVPHADERDIDLLAICRSKLAGS